MTLYDELVARGLIAQVTDEEEIKELINNGKATFYIGFDPTADSLHPVSFTAIPWLPGRRDVWKKIMNSSVILSPKVRHSQAWTRSR